MIPGEVSGASQLGQLEDAHGNCAQRFAKRLPERAPVPRVGPALVEATEAVEDGDEGATGAWEAFRGLEGADASACARLSAAARSSVLVVAVHPIAVVSVAERINATVWERITVRSGRRRRGG